MEDIVKSAIRTGSGSSTRQAAASDEEVIKISVIGVGGAGNNTINRLKRLGVKGANLIALNSDRQHLNTVDEGVTKLLIGKSVTKGLGCGGFPEVGAKCAEVDRPAIEAAIGGSHLVFICAGMGGGTGTGAASRNRTLLFARAVLSRADEFIFPGSTLYGTADMIRMTRSGR